MTMYFDGMLNKFSLLIKNVKNSDFLNEFSNLTLSFINFTSSITVRNITISPDFNIYLAKTHGYVTGLNLINNALSVLNIKKIITATYSLNQMTNVTDSLDAFNETDSFDYNTYNGTEIIDVPQITTENIFPEFDIAIYEMMNVTDSFEDNTLNGTEIIDITTEKILPNLFSIENTTQEQITPEWATTVTNYLNSTDKLGETLTTDQSIEWISTVYWNEWQPWTHCVFNRSKRNLISNEIYTETVHVSCDLISKWLNQL
jgi:hypothetical protein